MRRYFSFENTAFEYELIRSQRKTIAATVYPDQSVSVKAPTHATEEKIHDFLQRKLSWILKQRRYFSTFKTVAAKEYVSGESFRYLGRSYKLLVRKADETERVLIQHGTLTVESHFPRTRLHTKKLLDRWLTERAGCFFSDRLEACVQQCGLKESPDLAIRLMKSRWGSYSSKTNRVCLNLKLIHASKQQIDYVIIHELCHIKNLSHNKAFYRLLTHRVPDWKQIKLDLEHSLLSA